MKRSTLAVTVLILFLFGCSTQSSFFQVTSVDAYLNEMVDYMENNYINRESVNWTEFRANVQLKAINATSISEAKDAVAYAFELLNDQTSFLITATGQIISYGEECTDTAPPASTGSTEIGYIKMEPFSGSGVSAAVYAEKLHGEIRDQDLSTLKGWVIDLRGNPAGNIWPMIAGVGPILGAGTAGYFIDANNEKIPFGYENGSSTFNDSPIVTIIFPYSLTLITQSLKVAILMDHSTGNAAESVAVAFSGLDKSRSFGVSSCGKSGGTEPYQLSDGSTLYLTTSFLANRNEVSKQGMLQPDEVISDPNLVFDRAVQWINE